MLQPPTRNPSIVGACLLWFGGHVCCCHLCTFLAGRVWGGGRGSGGGGVPTYLFYSYESYGSLNPKPKNPKPSALNPYVRPQVRNPFARHALLALPLGFCPVPGVEPWHAPLLECLHRVWGLGFRV